MLQLLYALLKTARSSLLPQRELALENLALRQQLAIVQRKTKGPRLTRSATAAFADGACVLYVFLALEHERGRIVHFNVTEGPSALWSAGRS